MALSYAVKTDMHLEMRLKWSILAGFWALIRGRPTLGLLSVLLFNALAIGAVPAKADGDSELGLPFLRQYSDYTGHTQNWAAVQDRRGVMYFANTRGVLEYDGVDWRLLPLPRGSTVRSLALDPDGRILVGAAGDFGYLAPDSAGETTFVSLLDRLPASKRDIADVGLIHVLETGIFFVLRDEVLRWRGDELHRLDLADYCFAVRGKLYSNAPGRGLLRLAEPGWEPVAGGHRTAALPSLRFMLPFDDRDILLGVKDGGLMRFRPGQEGFLSPFPTEADEIFRQHRIYRGLHLPDGGFAVGTMTGGLVVLESDGSLRHHIDKERGLQDNSVWGLQLDAEGGLWLALNFGLARLDLATPLTSFDSSDGIEGTVHDIVRHDGVLYVASSLGLFALRAGRFVKLTTGSSYWSLLSLPGTALLAGSYGAVAVVEGADIQPVLEAEANFFVLEASNTDSAVIWSGSDHGLYRLRVRSESRDGKLAITPENLTHEVPEDIRTISEDSLGHLWLGTAQKGIIRRPPAGHGPIERFGVDAGLPDPPNYIKVFRLEDQLLFAHRTGLFAFDEASRRFVPSTALGPRFADGTLGVHRVFKGPGGGLWLRGYGAWDPRLPNLEFFSIFRRPGELTWSSGPLVRTVDAFTFLPEAEGITWMGGTERLYRYDRGRDKDYDRAFQVLVRRVLTKTGRVLFGGLSSDALSSAPPSLEYAENSLRFHYAAPTFDDEVSTKYSYLLDGFDEEFSPWTEYTMKEYTNLPEGRYVFRVRARNVYGTEGQSAAWPFLVRPPAWRTWWAYSLYVVGFFGLVGVGGRLQRQRLKQRERRRAAAREALLRAEAAERELSKALELEAKTRELLKAKEQLVHSEKMAALGQLVAGIAHEINNPINFILSGVPLMQEDLERLAERVPPDHRDADYEALLGDLHDLAEAIVDGAARTAGIVDGLRTFSRLDEAEIKPVDLNKSLDATLKLLNHQIKGRIEVERRYGELPPVTCYAGQLNQVFMNLLINAVQAIEGPGRITVTTEALGVDHVRISVDDTGRGMAEEVRRHLFEPFFTTKPVGQGTGLGLSISYGIIQRHGGTIEVDSRPGSGSSFILTLPVELRRHADRGPGAASGC